MRIGMLKELAGTYDDDLAHGRKPLPYVVDAVIHERARRHFATNMTISFLADGGARIVADGRELAPGEAIPTLLVERTDA